MSLRVLRAAMNEYGMVSHQLESFDDFISRRIQNTLDLHGNVEVFLDSTGTCVAGTNPLGAKLTFGRAGFGKCTLVEADGYTRVITPAEARHRNTTYARPLSVEVIGEFRYAADEPFKTYKSKVFLGMIPIMIKSSACVLRGLSDHELRSLDECPDDFGGYFIVQSTGSSEKNILAQERAAGNRPFVFAKEEALANRTVYMLELRSMDPCSTRVQMCSFKLTTEKFGSLAKLTCSLPFLREDLPITTLLKALGADDIEKEVSATTAATRRLLKIILYDSTVPETQHDALVAIGQHMGGTSVLPEDKARTALQRDFLIHLDPVVLRADEHSLEHKRAYATHCVLTILRTATKERPVDDRDHLGAKRFDLAGPLLGSLFRQAFMGMRSDLVKSLQKIIEKRQEFSVEKVVDSGKISRFMRSAIATGNFTSRGSSTSRVGVTQVLNRLNRVAMLSQLRRLNAPTMREGKLSKPRQLHNTQYGYICAAETPEGQQVGLVKNLALLTRVTTFSPSGGISTYVLDHMKVEPPGTLLPSEGSRLFVDGVWLCDVRDTLAVANELRDKRREGIFPGDTSVAIIERDSLLLVHTDEGRLSRPLFVARNGKIDVGADDETFVSLVERGSVEYIDALEEESCYIAFYQKDLTPEHTHCEIHPSTMLGVSATSIPFSHHNQAPRNVYQAAMGKQSIGLPMTNFAQRMDMKTNVLCYPQKAICESESSASDDLSQSIVLAISTYSGYNQEDSLVLNQSSVDRGLFRSFMLKVYVSEASRHQLHGREIFEIPNRATTSNMQKANYSKLQEDGVVEVGARVVEGDIIIGKTAPNTSGDGLARRDVSLKLKGSDGGIVDAVMRTTNESGNEIIKVRIRATILPDIGNKFASRHAQKGTCGILLRQEDMPYTSEGIVPCAIFNPHGIPSRMTIGHLLEMLSSKAAVVAGCSTVPATAFESTDMWKYSNELQKRGFHPLGLERMYDPRTGLRQREPTFIGIISYQVLKHIVCDKIHARGARGPTTAITRQPVEGRSRQGGLRIGEMERDSLLSHGASAVVRQLLHSQSDPWKVAVCATCKQIGYVHKTNGPMCSNRKCASMRVDVVPIPYASKLMITEMQTCGVSFTFGTSENP